MSPKTIPSYYTSEEVSRVFSAVDRSTAIGKRDHLVLCLSTIYGMRIGDIIDLRTSDIDWELGVVSKVQRKTGRTLCLPLTCEIREAILDYIEGARPETGDDHLIIRMAAPYVGYSCSSPFCKMVSDYMRKACIDTHGRHHGCHSLRHSAAGGMLAGGARIEQISDVLGHSSVSSTQRYLSFDAEMMAKIALEVPDVSF